MVRVHPCLPRAASAVAGPATKASTRSPHESGHRHASGWLESHRASRHARPRRRGRDLARLAKAALAGIVDGKLVDLSYPIEQDAAVRIVTDRSPEALPLVRHSTAHLLAAAVTNLFPGAQCGIGPATDEGFFYDFVVERPFVPEDLDAIEQKMKELAAAGSAVRAADVAARGGEGVLRDSAASRSRSS